MTLQICTCYLQLAYDMHVFFNAYPSVFRCLTRLSLHGVYFIELDMRHSSLTAACTQLKHLISLHYCYAGRRSVWKIDVPNSKLSVLGMDACCLI